MSEERGVKPISYEEYYKRPTCPLLKDPCKFNKCGIYSERYKRCGVLLVGETAMDHYVMVLEDRSVGLEEADMVCDNCKHPKLSVNCNVCGEEMQVQKKKAM